MEEIRFLQWIGFESLAFDSEEERVGDSGLIFDEDRSIFSCAGCSSSDSSGSCLTLISSVAL